MRSPSTTCSSRQWSRGTSAHRTSTPRPDRASHTHTHTRTRNMHMHTHTHARARTYTHTHAHTCSAACLFAPPPVTPDARVLCWPSVNHTSALRRMVHKLVSRATCGLPRAHQRTHPQAWRWPCSARAHNPVAWPPMSCLRVPPEYSSLGWFELNLQKKADESVLPTLQPQIPKGR